MKMNADQITEAHKRVAAFTPHKPGKDELPEPTWVKKIKLNGINGPDNKRLALIGNQILRALRNPFFINTGNRVLMLLKFFRAIARILPVVHL